MRNDRTTPSTVDPDLDALIARIHQDLRKERRVRRWREGAADRRKSLIALLLLLIPVAIAVVLSQSI